MYYRFTNSNNPMSDWGHAMFAENREAVEHYGANEYIFDGQGAVSINDLKDLIITAWNECQESEDFGSLYEKHFMEITAEEVFDNLNPEDIVNSADGWDTELVVWFWEFIAEPSNIMAVTTWDGAIVFDENLIK